MTSEPGPDGLGQDEALGPTEWVTGLPGPHTVGLGPWAEENPGVPAPVDPRYDPELLAEGDRRNVVDAYRYWTREAIVADLDTRRHPFHVAIENLGHDANIGTVVRTANAFGAQAVHIVGRKRWNRRGAMVTDRYQHLHHHADTEALAAWCAAAGLPIVAVTGGDADEIQTMTDAGADAVLRKPVTVTAVARAVADAAAARDNRPAQQAVA